MSVTEAEKSLDQLMQPAMSVYYDWDLTKKKEKDKRHHYLITAVRSLHPKLATIVDRRGTSTGNAQKGTAQETALPPNGTLPSLQR
jgi:hypothetical protein